MPNELALNEPADIDLLPPAQPPSLAARQMLHAHADMMQTAWELASKMVNTNLVPVRFRGKAEDGTAAILYGAELGLNPIQSLQRIVPIHGMPTLEARTMVALLKSRGYRIKTVEQSDEQVTVEGFDLDGERYVSQWTIERATKAGYVPTLDEKSGKYKLNANGKLIGNEKYLTDPQAMLKAKAQAEVCRDMAPDILLGISYTAEEMESERWDERPAPSAAPRSAPITVEEIFAEPGRGGGNDVSQGAEPSSGADVDTDSQDQADDRAQAIAQAQEQLDLDADTYAEGKPHHRDAQTQAADDDYADELAAEAADTDEPITKAQLQKLSILRQKEGYADTDDGRTDWFQWVNVNIGRLVGTNKDLTKAEAHVLIDVLESAQAQDGK